MKCMVTLTRSDEWVAAERLRTGDNVPETMEVETDPADLTEPIRAILLGHNCGHYPQKIHCLTYGGTYNREKFFHDGYTATPEEIGKAIGKAQATLTASKAAKKKEEAKYEAEKAAKREREAELKAQREAARALLSREIEQGEQHGRDRKTLSEFLAAVPQDALRGTLRRLAGEVDAAETLQKQVEDASLEWIFKDEVDEEED